MPPSEGAACALAVTVARADLLALAMSLGAMGFRTESRITIAVSVPEAWAYLCDVGRWPEWAPTVLECRIRGRGSLQPGSKVDQRAKGIFGSTRERSQVVTALEAPSYLAFAGPLGTSAARWGMELEPVGAKQTDAKMWIEVDLRGVMRAIPSGLLKSRVQGVSDREMASIKTAVESGRLASLDVLARESAATQRDRGARSEPDRPYA